MSLNKQELALFTKEFRELLPLKIEKLYIPQENILILTLYKKNFKKHLLIEVASNYSGLYFIKERPKQNLVANIQNRFRNLLLNGLIAEIKQINNDRILKLKINEYELILELTGRHGNIFILRDNIIEAILLLNKKDKKRNLSLYSNYLLPPYGQVAEPVRTVTVPVLEEEKEAQRLEETQQPEETLQLQGGAQRPQGGAQRPLHTNFLDYLENLYGPKIKELKQQELEKLIKNRINRKIKKLKNKKKNLLKDLEKLNSYKNYKNIGELLKSNLYQIKRGITTIKVINYYDENMPEIEIKLDSSKTPIENMEFYFKKYEKYKRGVKFINQELKKIDKMLNDLSNKDINLSTDIKNTTQTNLKIKKRQQNTHIAYKTYISSKGFKILVGKGSSDNDFLTFKVASGNDIWLHVLSYSGSHVVIKKNNKKDKIDINTIYEAAHLAILNSKAPKNDSVEVCYTAKKYVKKPPKSKPGAVIYTQEKRLYLQLDKKVVDNLKLI